MAEDLDESKEFEPSQRKLDEARKRGNFARSNDLTTAAVQGGFLLALVATGLWSVRELGSVLEGLLDGAPRLGDEIARDGAQVLLGRLLLGLAGPLAPWFAIPAGLALVSLIGQRAIAFSPEKLLPKLSRIDPVSNAGQKFGLSGLVEFAKSGIKLGLLATILTLFLLGRMHEIVSTAALSVPQGLTILADTLTAFLAVAVGLATAIGAADFLWQRFDHRRKMMMSRKEMLDEMKQTEGDPHLKQQRRQRGHDIATNRMIHDVPKADVVIVNPKHYAVALRWDRLPGSAPVCLAKGVDEVAARIRQAASAAGVPIHSDPPTARALHASVPLGHQIAPEHYRAVAAAIRFAEDMRTRARGRGR